MKHFQEIVLTALPIGFFTLACFMMLQGVFWIAFILLAVCVVFWLVLAGSKIQKDGRSR